MGGHRYADSHAPGVPQATRFENVPGHGATAQVDGRRVVVGNTKLMQAEGIDLGVLTSRREELAAGGRTAVIAAVDGRAAGVIGIADAARDSSAAAVAALHEAGVEIVMLTGDSEATARRIADQLGIDAVIAEVLPGDKAAKITELQRGGRKVAMVANLGWAIGYNTIALPIAAGVFEPAFGLVLRPEIAALSMSGSSFIVAVNALALKGLRLPRPTAAGD
ncbi:HAD-IC family P-type ATPase [Nonomuraea sp. CA-141351]|uniref:HAD-IC family P-type ATPase n=1 Tax=Nonomuraea sp. CA-141351 TaxID=3239996 RepID=UPI003D8B5EA0